jgi:hypothetical protein
MGYEAPQITSIGNMIAAGLGVSIVPISIVGSFLGTFCLSKDRLCFWQNTLPESDSSTRVAPASEAVRTARYIA